MHNAVYSSDVNGKNKSRSMLNAEQHNKREKEQFIQAGSFSLFHSCDDRDKRSFDPNIFHMQGVFCLFLDLHIFWKRVT